ncbi:sugar ABC transporter ATP-binding protein [Variovorax sp. DXTD-1]|uniref:sugar ABC transporter ATP-binding protein n=1 Tax=Variovorax sp. DXTD-1 TaxID=2495592 RepID=UPI000F87346A|nr:sugar ABC transporter ATP-binding protein [Variovorax sp. DXTD-1]RST48069.1 sugar ABC transporter ATP-binding protein [Variovorax sp. DXTD-1]
MNRAASPLLELKSISKRYGATVALSDVSFELRPGEVCGLLGENGAGKSTLVKTLSGVVKPDRGEILIRGAEFRPSDVVDARARGVSTAFQELSLVPTLSVAVNLFLPRPGVNKLGLVSTRTLEREAEQILSDHRVTDISPATRVEDLPLGLRQKIEIVRALTYNPAVLLLDEPTAALSDREWLFALIDSVIGKGTSVLYISHKLDEIRRLCRRCLILRNGRKVLDSEIAALSDNEIFSNMAGRSAVEIFMRSTSAIRREAPSLLEVSALHAPGVNDVSFALKPGEILGMAGLEGQGQSALFKVLSGLTASDKGAIRIHGKLARIGSPRGARAHGLVLVPEERKSEGLFTDLSTAANISLPVIDRATSFGLIDRKAERLLIDTVTPRVSLAEGYLPMGIGALSGGNQQKAILARALLAGPKCLLLFDPTRGVDVGAKQAIYEMMRNFALEGGAILFYSTELDELVGVCDRCLVLYQGAIAGELAEGEMSQDRILSLASGQAGSRGHKAMQVEAA